MEGERESDPFISSNWNPPRGILRFPKERSPRLSLLPLYPEKIPVELLSLLIQYRAGITLFPRTSSYRGMKVTGHCNYLPLFFYPHKSDPLLPPLLAEFFPPRVFERERRSCEKFHSRNASGKRKIVVVI